MSWNKGQWIGFGTGANMAEPAFIYSLYRDFHAHPSRPALGTTQPPCLSRGKAAGAWRWPHTPSSVGVKEKLEVYIYSHSGLTWHFPWWTLPRLWIGGALPPHDRIKLTCSLYFGSELSHFCHHGIIWHPLDGFSWNLMSGYFLKPCQENSSFINIWQE